MAAVAAAGAVTKAKAYYSANIPRRSRATDLTPFDTFVRTMDARQETLANPLGMDEDCANCRLCEDRERVVHGYGDVGADFLFVGEMPGKRTDRTGIPFAGTALWDVLADLGFADDLNGTEPALTNVYLTYLTRCRRPGGSPRDDEIDACHPFLTADVRMINPEVLIPVGGRALRELAAEHTTKPPDTFDVASDHARALRGRGFELVPTVEPDDWTEAQRASFVDAIRDLLGGDYRQTKGRRGRAERDRTE